MGKKTKGKKDKEKRPEQTTNIGIDFGERRNSVDSTF
jgi:hypothetical protein